MTALLSHLDAFLAREKVTLTEFCRVTGFPSSTVTSMRYAAAPKAATLDRLRAAIASWKGGRRASPLERGRAVRSTSAALYPDAWEKAAAAASDAYVRALGGRTFTDAEPSGGIVDLGGPFRAMSREACPRCGVRGDIGCAHQLPMAEAW